MKKNTAILSSFLLIFIASYFIYYKGEQAFQGAAETFDVLAFKNTNLSCDKDSLTFFIENNEEDQLDYTILISNQEKNIEEFNQTIPGKSSKLISPSDDNIKTICASRSSEKYQVIIKRNTQKQTIYKIIK